MEYTVQLERFGEIQGSYSHVTASFASREMFDQFAHWIDRAYREDPLRVGQFWVHHLIDQERITGVKDYPGMDKMMREYQTLFKAPQWKRVKGMPSKIDLQSSFTPIYCGIKWMDTQTYENEDVGY